MKKRRKLRSKSNQSKQLITIIENFSNELFYEIFDYLDGYDIFQSFSNLNYRFESIICSSNYKLKLNIFPCYDINIQNNYAKFIFQKKHQILSLHINYLLNIEQFFTLINVNSSFLYLQSFIFNDIHSNINLLYYLSFLILLPSLKSFCLSINYNQNKFHEIYLFIFKFPILKYLKFSSETYEPSIPLLISKYNQYSSIEYLNINHSCNLSDLILIISYTPKLYRLKCRELIKSNENLINIENIKINLKQICISECYVIFDILELFIKKISSKLEFLRINTYWDTNYLDANRWEKLIIEHIPYLKEFYFQYHEYLDDDFQITKNHLLINQFRSLFWLKQNYIFELIIDINNCSWTEIIYSIYPFFNNKISLDNISLTITDSIYQNLKELFNDNILKIFTLIKITELNILYKNISIELLINLIYYLPYLNSLKIHSFYI